MLRKDFALEVNAVEDGGVIEGYGSTFGGEPDSYGDVIERGAFSETIAAHKAAGTMPAMLWGHQAYELPIGDWEDMGEDRKGLWLKGRLDIEDPVGGRVYRALKAKRVRGLSIGYEVEASRDGKGGIRVLEKLSLLEISPVNFPANRNATVTTIKNDDAFARWLSGVRPQQRELETMLKKGFSVSNIEAERMANALLRDSRGGPDEEADARAFLKALVR